MLVCPEHGASLHILGAPPHCLGGALPIMARASEGVRPECEGVVPLCRPWYRGQRPQGSICGCVCHTFRRLICNSLLLKQKCTEFFTLEGVKVVTCHSRQRSSSSCGVDIPLDCSCMPTLQAVSSCIRYVGTCTFRVGMRVCDNTYHSKQDRILCVMYDVRAVG